MVKCEEGYGFMSVRRVGDKHKVVQIKKELAKNFNNLFHIESDSMIIPVEYVREELSQIRDFAFSFLCDVLEEDNHKIMTLSEEEYKEFCEQKKTK